MNIEKWFLDVQSFLIAHKTFMQVEVLEQDPKNFAPYQEWLNELKSLSKTELINLENSFYSEKIHHPEYLAFLDKIKTLTNVKKLEKSKEIIPETLKRKLSQKKQHELKQIKQLLKSSSYKHIVDIGSGAGHLSSYLLYENNLTSECIDLNSDFQNIGRDKLKRYQPDILKRLKFSKLEINKDSKLDEPEDSILIGLHACGDLSPFLVKIFASSSIENFLNFGCCYHKLTKDQLNISRLGKQHGILFSYHALTMAAKSYKTLTEKEYLEREKVKSYRYILHFLMQEKFQENFLGVGNASSNDYLGSFSSYAQKFYPKSQNLTMEALEAYYNSRLDKAQDLILLGIIRSHFSRLVEISLILDRAMYLQEKGYQVELIEAFNKNISPRNLAILAKN